MTSPTQEPKQGSVRRVAVVGAGVSGLAAAYKLKCRGFDVTVFEADGRAGGKLRSVSHGGLIWDEGANTMTESEPEVQALLDNLGLREKQQFPISQNKRYIVRNGSPVLLPTNPIELIKSNFLSTQSKLKIILEPYLWNKKRVSNDDSQESVGGFFERHFGKEVVDYLIDPIVAGTSGGDPESLSMRHSFPDMWNIEKRFGSVIAGAIKSKLSARKEKSGEAKGSAEKGKRQRGSFSFHGGMQTLTDVLCNQLGKDELKLNSKVLSLSYSHDGRSELENWFVSCVDNDDKNSQSLSVDAVVMTAPLGNVKEMNVTKRGTIFPLDFLPEVTYIPLSVIITTFKKENVKRPLEGFGVLVPSNEQKNGLKTLGTLFSSIMFPDRAPNDLYLYTTFVGGSRNKELAKASKDELKQIVTSDIRHLLGVDGEPTSVKYMTISVISSSNSKNRYEYLKSLCITNFLYTYLIAGNTLDGSHYHWSKAFPLYGRDYDSVIEAIEKLEKNLPGFFYAGNHRGGLSVGKAISSGCKAAELVISYLESPSDEKTRHEG